MSSQTANSITESKESKVSDSIPHKPHGRPSSDPEKEKAGGDSTVETTDEEAATAASPPSPRSEEVKQRWNESPQNIFRFLSTIYSFTLLGMSDAVIGALLPYVSFHSLMLIPA